MDPVTSGDDELSDDAVDALRDAVTPDKAARERMRAEAERRIEEDGRRGGNGSG